MNENFEVNVNEHLHQTAENYGDSHTYINTLLPEFLSKLLEHLKVSTVLDYGCGKGVLLEKFKSLDNKIDWRGYDPFFLKYKTEPKSANVLICLQALEHIEKDDVHNVLQHLIGLTENFFFLDIDLKPAVKTLPDGRNAHTCIAPSDWWLSQLSQKCSYLSMKVSNSKTKNQESHLFVVGISKTQYSRANLNLATRFGYEIFPFLEAND